MSTLPMNSGIGRIGQFLGAIPPAMGGYAGGPALEGVDPMTARALQNQAIMRMGLGMMAGREAGLGFGQSALGGMNQASDQYLEAMRTAFRQRLANKAQDLAEREFKQRGEIAKREDQRWMYSTTQEANQRKEENRIRAEALKLQAAQAQATIEAARSGQAVDAQKLADAKMFSERITPVLDKLARGIKITPEEEALLTVGSGSSFPGLIAARQQGLGQWGGVPMLLPGQAGAGGMVGTLANDPDL